MYLFSFDIYLSLFLRTLKQVFKWFYFLINKNSSFMPEINEFELILLGYAIVIFLLDGSGIW